MYALVMLAMLLAGGQAGQEALPMNPKLLEISAVVSPHASIDEGEGEELSIGLSAAAAPGPGTPLGYSVGMTYEIDHPVGGAVRYKIWWTGDYTGTGWGASPGEVRLRTVVDTDGDARFYIGDTQVGTYETGVGGGFAYGAISQYVGGLPGTPVVFGFRDLSAATAEGIVYEWPESQPLLGWFVYVDEVFMGGFSFDAGEGVWQRDDPDYNSLIYLGWPQHYERVQGCVRYGTLNTPWRYRTHYGVGLCEHRSIEDDTTQETVLAAMPTWPTGWVWPDGAHGALYEYSDDTAYRYGHGSTWYAGAILGADRTRPVMTQLAPSNDLLIAWMGGAACKCRRLRWNGAAYGTTETEYTIAASMVRPGSIDQLPDGRLVFVGENAAGVGYSLSSDDGATWGAFTALVAGAAYPVACRLGASQDLLLAYADQAWGEATVSVCRVAWDGSVYSVAAGTTIIALELGGSGQHPMDYLNSIDAIFERSTGAAVLLISLFNRLYGLPGYCWALIMQSSDGGATWAEVLLP